MEGLVRSVWGGGERRVLIGDVAGERIDPNFLGFGPGVAMAQRGNQNPYLRAGRGHRNSVHPPSGRTNMLEKITD